MRVASFIGGRYLVGRQRQAFITLTTGLSVAGVTVGVMALIVVISVMAGFEADLTRRILGINPHIEITRSGADWEVMTGIADRVATDPDVADAGAVVSAQAMIRSSGGTAGARIQGILPEHAGYLAEFCDGLFRLTSPPANDASPGPAILLGRDLAASVGALPGDIVYLVSPVGLISPMGHLPMARRFRVAGFINTGMYEYDGALALVNAAQALRLSGAEVAVHARLQEADRSDRVAERLSGLLGPDTVVRDWRTMNRNFFFALKLEKTCMFLLLSLIVLVAAFNIAGSLIMLVMEKTRDIAILKAMGATDRVVRSIFVFRGLAVGLMGTLLGTAAGVGLCLALKRHEFIRLPEHMFLTSTIPVRMNPADMVLIAVAAVVLCFLATLYPAGRAARLNPVEALRRG